MSILTTLRWSVIHVSDFNQRPSSIIKTPSRMSNKFSNANLSVRDGSDKSIKFSISFYAYNSEGALDFGKLAFDKVKLKRETNDVESKTII